MEWLLIPLFIFFGIIIAMLAVYIFIIRPRLKKVSEINYSIEEENKKLEQKNKDLEQKKEDLLSNIDNLKEIAKNNTITVAELNSRIEILQENAISSQKTAEETANAWYENYYSLMEEKFDEAAEKLSKQYSEYKNEADEEYLSIIEENVKNYQSSIEKLSLEAQKAQESLDLLLKRAHEANEDAKRKSQIASEDQKYHILLKDEDWAEIDKIREILPIFREKRPLKKMLWEGYYRDATSALLDRILDKKEKGMGIYKITNLLNQKIYIGQAVSLSDRLKTHVKAGLGIDANNNQMYKDMWDDGLKNFSFEIVEYCNSVNDLNNGEKYWINFFNSSDFGYNMTKGGAAVSSKVAK